MPGNRPSTYATLQVTYRDTCGTPFPNALIEIDLSDCPNLCVDSPESGLIGHTNANGQASLKPRVEGATNVRSLYGPTALRSGTIRS